MEVASSAAYTYVSGILSFVALVFASWCVGEGGEILGAKFDASVVGGLIIAWLNTAPEAIFFIQALNSGNPRFAMGAVSGSAIVVSTVAVGACVWIGASARKSGNFYLVPSVKKQCYVLAVSTLFPLGFAYYGFSLAGGVAAFLFYMAFLVYSLLHSDSESPPPAAQNKKQDDIEGSLNTDNVDLLDDEEEDDDHASVSTWKGVAFLVVGGGLIFLCSSPFISAVVEVSVLLKVSPTLLAFFLAPIASEMPEILEAISLSRRGHVQAINVAYSNLVGGTITKTTLLVGLFSVFGIYKDFVWEEPNYSFSLCLIAVCALCAALVGFVPDSLKSWHGLLLWGLFIAVALTQYFLNGTFTEIVAAAKIAV